MNKPLTLLILTLLAAPLALAQAPDNGPAQPPPPGMNGPAPNGPGDPHNNMHRDFNHPGGMSDGPGGRDDRGPRGEERGEGRDRGRIHDDRSPADLHGLRVPPGTWWRNPDVATRVGLSPDQVKKIDTIFLDARVQLIHMHASLEEEQLRLEPILSANPLNQPAAEAQIAKIADTRADLEKANAKMLLTIRGVLTADQWTRLSDHKVFFRGPTPTPTAIAPHGTHRNIPIPNNPPAPPAE